MEMLRNLLVEQKTGGFVVLSTHLIELPIQKTRQKTENWSKNVSRETVSANHRKAMRGRIVSPSAKANAYHEALRNDWFRNALAKASVNYCEVVN